MSKKPSKTPVATHRRNPTLALGSTAEGALIKASVSPDEAELSLIFTGATLDLQSSGQPLAATAVWTFTVRATVEKPDQPLALQLHLRGAAVVSAGSSATLLFASGASVAVLPCRDDLRDDGNFLLELAVFDARTDRVGTVIEVPISVAVVAHRPDAAGSALFAVDSIEIVSFSR